jgi:hypothetical protein
MRTATATIRAGALAIALAATTAAPALAGDHAQYALTKAGMAAARAALVQRSDFGAATGWTSHVEATGSAASDADAACALLHPRRSDLVVIGDAGVVWAHAGFHVRSGAQVLRSARMVELEWQRTLARPQALACMRTSARASGDPSWHFVSLNRLAFPPVGSHSAAFRALYDVDGARERLMLDVVFFARGRTEMTLTTVVPISAATPVRLVQIGFAQRLARRALP